MNADAVLVYCQENVGVMRVLMFLCICFFIAAIFFGVLYGAGVRILLPRLRRRLRAMKGEEDRLRAELLKSISHGARMETMVAQQGKEIARLDAIRKKTEARLTERNVILAKAEAELLEARDEASTLHQMIDLMQPAR